MKEQEDDIVYHYCTVDSFFKIISNSSLWLSDVLKSNDYKECIWTRDKIKYNIKNVLTKYGKKELTSWEIGCSLSIGFEYQDIAICAACFSENKDSLSQWRGYAQNGKGLAIGFSKKLFQSISDNMCDVVFSKVIYNEKEQKKFIDSIVEEMLQRMGEKGIGQVAIELNSNYVSKFPLCKNPSFKEENEWRLILITRVKSEIALGKYAGCSFGETKLRSTDERIISYLNMNFSDVKNQIIKEIWIGPKCNVTKSDVLNLLSSYDYYKNVPYNYDSPVKICQSASSYR